MHAEADPPEEVHAAIEAAFPDARIVKPVYRVIRDSSRPGSPARYILLFEDREGTSYRAEVDERRHATIRRVRMLDRLPAALEARFFEDPGAAVIGGRPGSRIWRYDDPEPNYEFEYHSASGRGLGRIRGSGGPMSATSLRP